MAWVAAIGARSAQSIGQPGDVREQRLVYEIIRFTDLP